MRLVETITVDFSAQWMHFDSRGNLWAFLKNRMLTKLDRSAGTSNEPFGEERFRAVYWAEDKAFLLQDQSLELIDLISGKRETINRLDVAGVNDPLFVDQTERTVFFGSGQCIAQHSMTNGLIREYDVGFRTFSLLKLPNNRLWVGGDGLKIIDTTAFRVTTLDSNREMPVLQMAYYPARDEVACAGGVIEIRGSDGKRKAGWGNSHFRCQFTRNGDLITRSLNGKHHAQPKISYDQIKGIAITEISDSNSFLSYELDGKECLVVSDVTDVPRLYFYENSK